MVCQMFKKKHCLVGFVIVLSFIRMNVFTGEELQHVSVCHHVYGTE